VNAERERTHSIELKAQIGIVSTNPVLGDADQLGLAGYPSHRIVINKRRHSLRFCGVALSMVPDVQPFHRTFHTHMHGGLESVWIVKGAHRDGAERTGMAHKE
jgi:hypothetical protein